MNVFLLFFLLAHFSASISVLTTITGPNFIFSINKAYILKIKNYSLQTLVLLRDSWSLIFLLKAPVIVTAVFFNSFFVS